MEDNLTKFRAYWKNVKFLTDENANNPDIKILKIDETDFETLEEHQVLAQNMNASRYVGTFGEEIPTWCDHLAKVNECCTLLNEIQRTWA